jgi:hypothetical protein
MGNVGQPENTPTLAQEAIVGMLLAASGDEEVPARPWPLVSACQTLANRLPSGSPYSSALETAKHTLLGGVEVETWLRGLAERGAVLAQGRMADARWLASPEWLANWRLPAQEIHEDEAEAWASAAQALTNCLSIWRKTVSAAARSAGPSATN